MVAFVIIGLGLAIVGLKAAMKQLPDFVYLIGAAVAGIGLLGWLMWNGLFGESRIGVYAPRGHTVSVQLDDDAPVEVRGAAPHVFTARPGTHRVRSRDEKGGIYETSVKIRGGGQGYVAPTSPDQCFVFADVTQTYQASNNWAGVANGKLAAKQFEPTIDVKNSDHLALRLRPGTYFTAASLPRTQSGKVYSIYVVGAVGCDELEKGDDALLAELGL